MRIIQLAIIFFILNLIEQIKSYPTCPNSYEYHRVQFDKGKFIQNSLIIPHTNIMIVNTMNPVLGAENVFYYIDIESQNVINAVETSTPILSLIYISKLNAVVGYNKMSFLILDTYTLDVIEEKKIIDNGTSAANFEGTSIIVLTSSNKLAVAYNIETQQIIGTYYANSYQDFVRCITLQNEVNLIILMESGKFLFWELETGVKYNGLEINPVVNVNFGVIFELFPGQSLAFVSHKSTKLYLIDIQQYQQLQFQTLYTLGNVNLFISYQKIFFKLIDIQVILDQNGETYNLSDYHIVTVQISNLEQKDYLILIISDNYGNHYFYRLPKVYNQANFEIVPIKYENYYYYLTYLSKNSPNLYLLNIDYIGIIDFSDENFPKFSFMLFHLKQIYLQYLDYSTVGVISRTVGAYQGKEVFVSLYEYNGEFKFRLENDKGSTVLNEVDYTSSVLNRYQSSQIVVNSNNIKICYKLLNGEILIFNVSTLQIEQFSLYEMNDWTYSSFQYTVIWDTDHYQYISYNHYDYGQTIISINLNNGQQRFYNTPFYEFLNVCNTISFQQGKLYGATYYTNIIYTWDLQSGEILHFKTTTGDGINQMIVVDSLKILLYFDALATLYQYSEITDEAHKIYKFTAFQTTFKYFEEIQMAFTGEQDHGYVYGFKYNQQTLKFEFFISIKSIFESSVLEISFTPITKLLYVNTQYSNLFFDISKCILNIDDCFSCSQDFHISNSEVYDKVTGAFGQGKIDNPFTTQQSLIQSFLTTQRYKLIVPNVKNIETTIYIHNKYQMMLYQYILAFNFQKLLQLTIKSHYVENQDPSVIQISGDLQLSNFQKVTLENIQLLFDTNNNVSCSLIFDSLKSVATLINIQMINKNQLYKDSCNIIQSINTDLVLKDFKLDNKSFIKHKNFITSTGAKNIKIENLVLTNSDLGMFNIYSQKSHTSLEIDGLIIQGNRCDLNNFEKSQQTFSLFLAGVIKASNIKIIQNQLCNLNLLQTAVQDDQQNIEFILQDILIQDNTIWAVSQSILFSSLFSFIPQPDHKIVAQRITSLNNNIQQQANIVRDQYFFTNLIQTNKINSISLNEIILNDNHYLSFIDSEESQNFEVQSFECSYSDSYMQTHNKTPSAGCIKIQESKIVTINEFVADKKITFEQNLIEIINQKIDEAQISIKSCSFKNIPIIQTKVYKQANPLSITASYENQIKISDCLFSNNNLLGIPNSVIPSTAGLYINNLIGTLLIDNSVFQNLFSNTDYVGLHAQVGNIEIKNSNFASNLYKSSEADQKPADIVKKIICNGGSIFAKTETLKIDNSKFMTTDSYQGGFIYLNSFTNKLSVTISNSIFKESFTKLNGGFLYFNVVGSSIYLEISDTKIEDIYQLNFQSSLIFLNQDYIEKSTSIINEIKIKNVDFINIYGFSESQIFQLTQTKLTIEKSDYYFVEKDMSNTLLPLTVFETQVPSQFIFASRSQGEVKDVTLYNIIDNYSDTYDHQILFSSEYSNFKFTNCVVRDSQINIGGIGYFFKGEAQFDKFIAYNINFKSESQSNRQLSSMSQSEIQGQTTITFLQFMQSSVTIINTKATNIDCLDKCFGGFIYGDSSQINIKFSNFQLIKSNEGGALYILNPLMSTIIQDCIFDQNVSSVNGGSVLISSSTNKDFSILVKNNKFTNNNAKTGKGGSIFIEATLVTANQKIILQNNIIQQNIAFIGGGLKYEGIVPSLEGNIISNNIAELYGQDVFSYPSKLYLENANNIKKNNTNIEISDNLIVIKNHRSGASLPNMIFSLRNQDNDILKLINMKDIISTFIVISVDKLNPLTSQYYIRGNANGFYQQNDNVFELKDIDLIGKPQSNINLYIKSDLIRNIDNNTGFLIDNYSYIVQVQIDECQVGEIPKYYNGFEECSVCEKGTYSFDKQTCSKCPIGANCLGGKQIIVESGYWRKDENDNSIVFCEHLEENCKGGESGDSICYEGHIGPLCEECDIYGGTWGESYAKTGKYQCAKCSEISNNSIIVVLMTLWTLISMVLAIKGDLDSIKKKAFSNVLSKVHTRRKSVIEMIKISAEQDQTGVYLKIFTNYFQIISSIASFNLAVPSGVIEFPQSMGQPIQQTINSLDCALVAFDSSMPIIYFRFVFSVVMPLIYLFIFVLGIVIYQLAKRRKNFPYYIIYTALIFLLIYIQPDLVAQMISLISCREIGGNSYILSNVTYECFTSSYYKWGLGFILPMLFSYVLLFPFLLFNQLRKKKENLQNLEVKLKYGFLYQEYTEKCFYWEFVKMAEKISIILVLNFYSQDIKSKGVLVFIAITLYSIGSVLKRPYKNIEINKLDQHSTNVCAISVLMGVFLYSNQYNYFVYIAFSVIIGLNIWFILLMIRKIIRGYTQKLDKAIQSLLERISNKFKFIASYLMKKQIKENKIAVFNNKPLKEKVKGILLSLRNLTPQQRKLFMMNMSNKEKEITIENPQNILKQEKQNEVLISSNENTNKKVEQEDDYNLIKQDLLLNAQTSNTITMSSPIFNALCSNTASQSLIMLQDQASHSPFLAQLLAKNEAMQNEDFTKRMQKIQLDEENKVVEENKLQDKNEGELKLKQFQIISTLNEFQLDQIEKQSQEEQK